jgi:hypothetical protein
MVALPLELDCGDPCEYERISALVFDALPTIRCVPQCERYWHLTEIDRARPAVSLSAANDARRLRDARNYGLRASASEMPVARCAMR